MHSLFADLVTEGPVSSCFPTIAHCFLFLSFVQYLPFPLSPCPIPPTHARTQCTLWLSCLGPEGNDTDSGLSATHCGSEVHALTLCPVPLSKPTSEYFALVSSLFVASSSGCTHPSLSLSSRGATQLQAGEDGVGVVHGPAPAVFSHSNRSLPFPRSCDDDQLRGSPALRPFGCMGCRPRKAGRACCMPHTTTTPFRTRCNCLRRRAAVDTRQCENVGGGRG